MDYDQEDQVCTKQAFTASAVSQDAIQRKNPKADYSIGNKMCMGVFVAIAAAGGASWALQAIQADNLALTTNLEVIGQVTCVDADMFRGARIPVPIMQGKMSKEFLGFRAVPTGGSSPTVTLDVYYMDLDQITLYKPFPKINSV